MPVTDLQVAALRALLSRDFDENRRLMGVLGDEGLRKGYFPLLTGAFIEAVLQRFRGTKRSDIIEWVADIRAQRETGGPLDPNVAERLILWVFDKATTDDLDFNTEFGHQMLLASLVEEQEFDDAGLDAFLAKARESTDVALNRREQ
jgi:hypothetical protein